MSVQVDAIAHSASSVGSANLVGPVAATGFSAASIGSFSISPIPAVAATGHSAASIGSNVSLVAANLIFTGFSAASIGTPRADFRFYFGSFNIASIGNAAVGPARTFAVPSHSLASIGFAAVNPAPALVLSETTASAGTIVTATYPEPPSASWVATGSVSALGSGQYSLSSNSTDSYLSLATAGAMDVVVPVPTLRPAFSRPSGFVEVYFRFTSGSSIYELALRQTLTERQVYLLQPGASSVLLRVPSSSQFFLQMSSARFIMGFDDFQLINVGLSSALSGTLRVGCRSTLARASVQVQPSLRPCFTTGSQVLRIVSDRAPYYGLQVPAGVGSAILRGAFGTRSYTRSFTFVDPPRSPATSDYKVFVS